MEKWVINSVLIILLSSLSLAQPVLHFSDIISGPCIGNTDGAGNLNSSQHGAIVTVWGTSLESSQGSSKVYINDSAGNVSEAAYVYYWKNADGNLPGGPAELYRSHKMQEIAFSIPSSVSNGLGHIYVVVRGQKSRVLNFTVREGNIKFIRSTGEDIVGNGDWDTPLQSFPSTLKCNILPH